MSWASPGYWVAERGCREEHTLSAWFPESPQRWSSVTLFPERGRSPPAERQTPESRSSVTHRRPSVTQTRRARTVDPPPAPTLVCARLWVANSPSGPPAIAGPDPVGPHRGRNRRCRVFPATELCSTGCSPSGTFPGRRNAVFRPPEVQERRISHSRRIVQRRFFWSVEFTPN